MKKVLLTSTLALVGLAAIGAGSSIKANAAIDDPAFNYGDNMVSTDLFTGGASDYRIPVGWDNRVLGYLDYNSSGNEYVTQNPDEDDDLCLRLDNVSAFADFAVYMPTRIPSGTFNVSFDYKDTGSADNIGFHIYCPDAGQWNRDCNIFNTSDRGAWGINITNHPTRLNWKHVTGSILSFSAGDTIAFWANADAGTVYMDNISVEDDDGNEYIEAGDFNAFKDIMPLPELTAEPNTNGFFGEGASAGAGKVEIAANGYLGVSLSGIGSGLYQLDVKGNGTLKAIVKAGNDEKKNDAVAWASGAFTTQWSGIAGADALIIKNEGTEKATLTELSYRLAVRKAFDPTKTYYEVQNLTVNGDFEAFTPGTVLSETQLEGAWGSVNLDNPARIVQEENGNKAAALGRFDNSDSKNWSSMFLMTPDTLEIGDLLRIKYDIKLVLGKAASTYGSLDSCLVGGANKPYYQIEYKNGMPLMTNGNEKTHVEVKNVPAANGYTSVTIDIEITNDIIQWNSLRWLMTPQQVGDLMYIDNVKLSLLDDELPTNEVTSIEIVEGDQELQVGAVLQLTLDEEPKPHDATTYTWTSSDEGVVTVDQTGKITAVAEGAAEITVTAANGVNASIIVVVTAGSTPSAGGCGGSITAVSALVCLTSALGLAIALRRKHE